MRASLRFIMLLAFFVCAGYFIFQIRHVFLPFILAATASYLLHPLVQFFEVRGLKHRPVVITVYAVLMCLYLGGVYLVISLGSREAAHVASDLPRYVEHLRLLVHVDQSIESRFPVLAPLGIDEWLREHRTMSAQTARFSRVMTLTPAIAGHVLPLLELLLLVPFLTFFFMLDGTHIKAALLRHVPVRHVETTLHLLSRIDTSLGHYIRGLLLQALAMGIAAGIGYGVMGLHYYLQISLWVAVTSMIPLIGSISAALAGAIVALFQWGTFSGLAKVLVVFIAIRLLDDWFLQPFILRRAVQIHPAIIVFALMAGATLSGFWGAIFAVPIACAVKVFCEVIWEWFKSEHNLDSYPIREETAQVPLL